MPHYRRLLSLIEGGKNIDDCYITGNKLRYSSERIKLNAAFTSMKALFTGPSESMEDQVYILDKCFGPKGLKNSLGEILFSQEFNNILTPEILLDMESSFRSTFNQNFGQFNKNGFNEELFNTTRRYVRVKGKYMIGTVSKLRPPQVMCLRNAILNREENFHKKACVMMNPEYTPEDDNEIDNLMDRIEFENSVTEELTDAIAEKKIVAVTTMDKIMASCRSGKCIMMLILMMINTEDKMNVKKALVNPMCLVDGIPMYNESVHFTSYVKSATKSVEKYFNIGTNMDENRTILERIKNVRTLDDLRLLVSDDCYLFTSLFSHVLLEEMPNHLKTDEMNDGGSCTWLYFLLSNVIQISAATWGTIDNRLVFTSTPQAINMRLSTLKKAKRVYDTKKSSPKQILIDALSKCGFTYADEDDAGIGQGQIKNLLNAGGILRSTLGTIIRNVPTLAVSATGESSYYRLFMRYSGADAMTAGVIRKMVVYAYQSGVKQDDKLRAVMRQYETHLRRHPDVEARNMKAIFFVSSVKDAEEFSKYVNGGVHKIPMGVFNPRGDQTIKATYSTTRDGVNDDIIGDFQTDDNHILFVMNKGSRGVGTQFLSFVGFIKAFSEKSMENAKQALYRGSVPITKKHLLERSGAYMETMTPEDRRRATMAMEKYVKEQVGVLSFPSDLLLKGKGKASLVKMIKSVGFEMSAYLVKEGGIKDEVCGECRCSISMEESVRNDEGVHYHARCVQSQGMEVVRDNMVKIPVTEEDLKNVKWGFVSSISKKKDVDHRPRKLEVMKAYIESQGGSYACESCGMNMYPSAKPLGLPEGLNGAMSVIDDSLVELMEEKESSGSIPDAFKKRMPVVRVECKPQFIKLGDGDFSYNPTPCESCKTCEQYSGLNQSSGSSSERVTGMDDLTIETDDYDGSDGSVFSGELDRCSRMETGEGSTDDVSMDDVSTDSSDHEDCDTPMFRGFEVVRPPVISVGPVETDLVVQCGPTGVNGICRALEQPKNMSSSDIIKTLNMTNEEMDRSSGGSFNIKRKRTAEEEGTFDAPVSKRTTTGSSQNKYINLLIKMVHCIQDTGCNDYDDLESKFVSQEEESRTHDYILDLVNDDSASYIRDATGKGSVGDFQGISVVLTGHGKLQNMYLHGEADVIIGLIGGRGIKEIFLGMVRDTPVPRSQLISRILSLFDDKCKDKFGDEWDGMDAIQKNHRLRHFFGNNRLNDWGIHHDVVDNVFRVWN